MLVEDVIFEAGEEKSINFDFTDDLEEDEVVPAVGADVEIIERIEDSDEEIEEVDTILDGDPTLSGNVYTQKLKNIIDETIYIVECSIETDLGNVYERSVRVIGREE